MPEVMLLSIDDADADAAEELSADYVIRIHNTSVDSRGQHLVLPTYNPCLLCSSSSCPAQSARHHGQLISNHSPNPTNLPARTLPNNPTSLDQRLKPSKPSPQRHRHRLSPSHSLHSRRQRSSPSSSSIRPPPRRHHRNSHTHAHQSRPNRRHRRRKRPQSRRRRNRIPRCCAHRRSPSHDGMQKRQQTM